MKVADMSQLAAPYTNMDKKSHAQEYVRWNYLSFTEFQWVYRWIAGIGQVISSHI